MADTNFLLTGAGEVSDVRSLMTKFQLSTYPGGLMYELIIRDPDIHSEAMRVFGTGKHLRPEAPKQSRFLSYLFPIIGLKCGRVGIKFWANSIEEIEVANEQIFLKVQLRGFGRGPGGHIGSHIV